MSVTAQKPLEKKPVKFSNLLRKYNSVGVEGQKDANGY